MIKCVIVRMAFIGCLECDEFLEDDIIKESILWERSYCPHFYRLRQDCLLPEMNQLHIRSHSKNDSSSCCISLWETVMGGSRLMWIVSALTFLTALFNFICSFVLKFLHFQHPINTFVRRIPLVFCGTRPSKKKWNVRIFCGQFFPQNLHAQCNSCQSSCTGFHVFLALHSKHKNPPLKGIIFPPRSVSQVNSRALLLGLGLLLREGIYTCKWYYLMLFDWLCAYICRKK